MKSVHKTPLLLTSQTWLTRVYDHPRPWLELSLGEASFGPMLLLCACSLWFFPFSDLTSYLRLSQETFHLRRFERVRFSGHLFPSCFGEMNPQGLSSRDDDAGSGAHQRMQVCRIIDLPCFPTLSPKKSPEWFQITPNSPALNEPLGRSESGCIVKRAWALGSGRSGFKFWLHYILIPPLSRPQASYWTQSSAPFS